MQEPSDCGRTSRIDWIIPVWGKAYVDQFCRYSLPSQLSPGNFPRIADRAEGQYVIYTRRCDLDDLESSAAFQRLKTLTSVVVRLIQHDDARDLEALPENAFCLMSLCQEDALEKAAAREAGCAFLVADAVLGDGSIFALQSAVDDGADLVLTGGLRAVKESLNPWMDQLRDNSGGLSIDPRSAIRFYRESGDRFLDLSSVESVEFCNGWPSILTLPFGEGSVAFSIFHPHPIYVRAKAGLEVSSTIDHGSFVEAFLEEGCKVKRLDRSDAFFILELSERTKIESAAHDSRPFDLLTVSQFNAAHTRSSGFEFASRAIQFLGCDADLAAFPQAEKRLADLAANIEAGAAAKHLRLRPLGDLGVIDRARPVYFYGAGDLGVDLWTEMDAHGDWAFAGYVDTFKSGAIQGKPVYSYDDFSQRVKADDQIIVTTGRLTEVLDLLEPLAARIGFAEVIDGNVWRADRAKAVYARSFSFSRDLPLT